MSREPELAVDLTLPGQQIRQTREAAGLSVADLAGAVKMTPSVIQAIEADDYARLPGLPFVRGYLLNIQKALGITDGQLVDQFDRWRRAQEGDKPSVYAAKPGSMSAPVKPHPMRRWVKLLPWVLLVVAVALVIRFDVIDRLTGWIMPVQQDQAPQIAQVAIPDDSAVSTPAQGESVVVQRPPTWCWMDRMVRTNGQSRHRFSRVTWTCLRLKRRPCLRLRRLTRPLTNSLVRPRQHPRQWPFSHRPTSAISYSCVSPAIAGSKSEAKANCWWVT